MTATPCDPRSIRTPGGKTTTLKQMSRLLNTRQPKAAVLVTKGAARPAVAVRQDELWFGQAFASWDGARDYKKPTNKSALRRKRTAEHARNLARKSK